MTSAKQSLINFGELRLPARRGVWAYVGWWRYRFLGRHGSLVMRSWPRSISSRKPGVAQAQRQAGETGFSTPSGWIRIGTGLPSKGAFLVSQASPLRSAAVKPAADIE